MDKNNFETYEFLPTNVPENEHFFVMQENGTFLISRHAVQYEAQSQEAKSPLAMENIQECTVYDVSPQQFLVDVDNSSELITVQDQFILPDNGNNLYGNNYLLQPGTVAASEPMEVNVEFEQTESQVTLDIEEESNKQSNSCTEITLTDEQYQILEQKGWILLAISDKIFVLDTFGLHDITTNERLIQKLKSEGRCHANPEAESGMKNANDATKNDNLHENNIATEQETKVKNPSLPLNEKESVEVTNAIPSSGSRTEGNIDVVKEDSAINTRVVVIENENIRRVGNTLKVKTKLSLKDFPEKILLGKTVTGKNLIAKVVKHGVNDSNLDTQVEKPEDNSQAVNNVSTLHIDNNNILNESEFNLLMKHCFQNKVGKCSAEDVVAADSIVLQLLQIPDFKSSVIDNNLIITKMAQVEDTSDKLVNKACLTAVVTGRVSQIAGQWRFVHLPHMLQKMFADTETLLLRPGNKMLKKESHVLHVQISETKLSSTGGTRVSVTANKRNIHLITNLPSNLSNTVYACCACATVCNTEQELKDHQANNCLEQDDTLTIDMEQQATPGDYAVIKNGNQKTYACMQCAAQFTRLATCKKHLNTHCSPKLQDTDENVQTGREKDGGKPIYKCNMCPSTYFHPSTLSKHIVTRHIKIKT